MVRTTKIVIGFLAAVLLISPQLVVAQEVENPTALQVLDEEIEIADLLRAFEASAPDGPVAITNVQIVDPDAEMITPGQAVIVDRGAGGRITWVGDAETMPAQEDLEIVDGGGRFLAPGLVDMHIHAASMSEWLLDLATGVTAVREMDGYPWSLAVRRSINSGRMLAPTLYVAGTIINARPMSGYAVVAANSSDARRIVREQAACGYDFIKVHNIVPQAIFDAVAEQAHTLGMDVVGHVPHEVELGAAMRVLRTSEHLKGFLHDQTLLPNKTNFKRALKGAETWVTPTLYTRYDTFRGEEAQAILDSDAARYVPARRRAEWRALINEGLGEIEAILAARFEATQDEVMTRLAPLKPRWLAGTDAAGYAFNIMGFALIEELRLMQEHGLTPGEALRSATSEPARAMRQETEFGRVARNMRADLVLLDADPLKDPAAYKSNAGVMARGVWLSRDAIDAALAKLAEIYADKPASTSTLSYGDIAERAEATVEAGYVFAPFVLSAAADALASAGKDADAKRLRALVVQAAAPPCGQDTPQ